MKHSKSDWIILFYNMIENLLVAQITDGIVFLYNYNMCSQTNQSVILTDTFSIYRHDEALFKWWL